MGNLKKVFSFLRIWPLVSFKKVVLVCFLQLWHVCAPTANKQTPRVKRMVRAWSRSSTWMVLNITFGPAFLKQNWFLLGNPSIVWVQKICVILTAATLIFATKLIWWFPVVSRELNKWSVWSGEERSCLFGIGNKEFSALFSLLPLGCCVNLSARFISLICKVEIITNYFKLKCEVAWTPLWPTKCHQMMRLYFRVGEASKVWGI